MHFSATIQCCFVNSRSTTKSSVSILRLHKHFLAKSLSCKSFEQPRFLLLFANPLLKYYADVSMNGEFTKFAIRIESLVIA